MCQCPHGLVAHFYLVNLRFLPGLEVLCQCPHGLVAHFYLVSVGGTTSGNAGVNALTGW